MQYPKLYRRRYIPNETIWLKDDVILHIDNSFIATRWNTLKPRRDIATGISGYFLSDGIKVSKVFDVNGMLVHWYCDIINAVYNGDDSSYVFEDLLLDVVIDKAGALRVLDTGETAYALKENIITKEQLIDAMFKLDKLLNLIYSGEFKKYQSAVEAYE